MSSVRPSYRHAPNGRGSAIAPERWVKPLRKIARVQNGRMSGAAHYERTVRLPSIGRDLALLAAIEQVVLDASAAIPWREVRSLERSVEVRSPNGSLSVTSVDDASKQLARSGLTVDSVQLLIREPLRVAPEVR